MCRGDSATILCAGRVVVGLLHSVCLGLRPRSDTLGFVTLELPLGVQTDLRGLVVVALLIFSSVSAVVGEVGVLAH